MSAGDIALGAYRDHERERHIGNRRPSDDHQVTVNTASDMAASVTCPFCDWTVWVEVEGEDAP